MIRARIVKRFAAAPGSAEFSLDVDFEATAAITVLFGPSGAGKTLILDSIAGFVTPDAGRIVLDDEALFDSGSRSNRLPRDRRCGYVFQNYALFPHMTLRGNLEFAAERRPRLERHRKVAEMIDRFQLAHAAGRYPHELSGGERQRCSIARALITAPKLLLLDEPARGLDAPLRDDLYGILRQVRDEFSTPVLLVTHDLEECFALGDAMLVLRAGRVIQTGTPQAVLARPATASVARLLGNPNVFAARITTLDPARNSTRFDAGTYQIDGLYAPGHLRGDSVSIAIDPSRLHATPANGARATSGQLRASLERSTPRPRSVRMEFAGGLAADIAPPDFDRWRDNKEWLIDIPADAVQVLKHEDV